MKQSWTRLVTRIDALTLRERAIIFALSALVLITAVNLLLLEPMFKRNKQMSEELRQNQATIADLQRKIQVSVKQQTSDPDKETKARLQALTQQARQLQSSLQEVKKGLVTPDKMAGLLEGMLRRHGNLHLLALKTLPAANLGDREETTPSNAKETAANGSSGSSGGEGKPVKLADKPMDKQADGSSTSGNVYRHGVEITVQGNYLDMVGYMKELETMPWQVFWGKAALNAEDYSKSTLTLTLYTLSLDKEWLNL